MAEKGNFYIMVGVDVLGRCSFSQWVFVFLLGAWFLSMGFSFCYGRLHLYIYWHLCTVGLLLFLFVGRLFISFLCWVFECTVGEFRAVGFRMIDAVGNLTVVSFSFFLINLFTFAGRFSLHCGQFWCCLVLLFF